MSRRAEDVAKLVDDFGYLETSRMLGIQKETVRRYVRKHKQANQESQPAINENLMRRVTDRFSEAEIKKILASTEMCAPIDGVRHSFEGEEVTIGVLTDTHLGSKYTNTDRLFSAFDEFQRQGVDFITHAGDVHEGLSHRPGHVYECSHIGYSEQLEHSREVFSQWTDTPIYMIDGNHDRWFIKSNGAKICEELARSVDCIKFIGHDEGDIHVGGCSIKLWHGEDGSSYAFSYRVQKIVESFTGGEKPSVFICGHTHKAMYLFDRNVHCVSAGSMQDQSKWMRGKRQASHVGFWIINMTIDGGEVISFNPRFYPFYK